MTTTYTRCTTYFELSNPLIITFFPPIFFVLILRLRSVQASKRNKPRVAEALAEAQKIKADFPLQENSSQNLTEWE